MITPKHTEFIPARESSFVIWFFKWYSWFLAKRRFRSFNVRNRYSRLPSKSTLYILNHHYWWDGLTPLILNEFLFHQHARAVMEDKQMIEFPFFAKIGAFSINRSNPKQAMNSLKYGAKWLDNSDTCLFLYPEGKFSQPHERIEIEPGITKLLEWSKDSDLVNISMHISYQKESKPDIFIDISPAIQRPSSLSKQETLYQLNDLMNTNLNTLRSDSVHELSSFIRLI